MASATIKLQTNIPVTGVIDYCDFMPTRTQGYSDQIAVRGKWEGAGEGRIYLPMALETELQKIGVIGQRGANGNYPLLINQPLVKFTKTENGQKKFTTVELLNASGATRSQPSNASSAASETRAFAAGPTLQDIVETYEDCVNLAATICNNTDLPMEGNCREIATTLFINRSQRNLYGKTEQVPV